MKYLLLCLLAVGYGCSAEAPVPEKTVSNETPHEIHQLPPSTGDFASPCPKPLVFTTVVDGKEVQVVYELPCYPGVASTSKASDPPGWGPNTNGPGDLPGYLPGDVPSNPITNPVPHKF